MDRSGGEAFQLTKVKGRLQSYEWSPDSKRLALVVADPDPDADPGSDSNAAPAKPKTPKPIVIDRYHFKQDVAADWGHLEVEDLQAGIDYAVTKGIADPDRLGVGGWSYGGILTNYTIASDHRFKATTSGAGTGFTISSMEPINTSFNTTTKSGRRGKRSTRM